MSDFFVSVNAPPGLLVTSAVGIVLQPFGASTASSVKFDEPIIISLYAVSEYMVSKLTSETLQTASPIAGSISYGRADA